MRSLVGELKTVTKDMQRQLSEEKKALAAAVKSTDFLQGELNQLNANVVNKKVPNLKKEIKELKEKTSDFRVLHKITFFFVGLISCKT